jgi:hypothetical protein
MRRHWHDSLDQRETATSTFALPATNRVRSMAARPISDEFSQGTSLNKSCPRNHLNLLNRLVVLIERPVFLSG